MIPGKKGSIAALRMCFPVSSLQTVRGLAESVQMIAIATLQTVCNRLACTKH